MEGEWGGEEGTKTRMMVAAMIVMTIRIKVTEMMKMEVKRMMTIPDDMMFL